MSKTVFKRLCVVVFVCCIAWKEKEKGDVLNSLKSKRFGSFCTSLARSFIANKNEEKIFRRDLFLHSRDRGSNSNRCAPRLVCTFTFRIRVPMEAILLHSFFPDSIESRGILPSTTAGFPLQTSCLGSSKNGRRPGTSVVVPLEFNDLHRGCQSFGDGPYPWFSNPLLDVDPQPSVTFTSILLPLVAADTPSSLVTTPATATSSTSTATTIAPPLLQSLACYTAASHDTITLLSTDAPATAPRLLSRGESFNDRSYTTSIEPDRVTFPVIAGSWDEIMEDNLVLQLYSPYTMDVASIVNFWESWK